MITHSVTYMTPWQLSYLLRCGESTVAGWRARGVGPAYRTHRQKRGYRGTLYTYRVTDVAKFLGGVWPESGQFMKTWQVAKHLGVSPGTVRQWRRRGRGPAPYYFVGLVRYLPEDLS